MNARHLSAVAGLVALAWAGVADARPGDLDRRYGGRDGVAGTSRIEGSGAVTLDRGRLLVTGDDVAHVARFTPRGRLDRRFGRRGVAADLTLALSVPFAIRRRGDGLLVHAFSASSSVPPLRVLELDRSGRSVRTVTSAEPFPGPIGAAVARRDGGAYLVSDPCGLYFGTCPRPSQIRALRPDGTTDPAFAGGTVDACSVVPAGTCTRATAASARRDGRLLVATVRGRFSDPQLVQLRPDGTVDPRFGRVDLPVRADVLRVARDGDVLVLGHGDRGRLARLSRISPRGTLRRSFGRRGVARVGPRGTVSGAGSDLVTDGRDRIYVVAGRAHDYGSPPPDRRSYVSRLSPSGRPFRRFGRRGTAGLPVPRDEYGRNVGNRLVLDRRGGLLVVGARLAEGTIDRIGGCGVRDDLCAHAVALAVWRFRR